ncbi:hypothetical protein LF817_16990 [Halobacillus sp. A1]|uniref:hypothetical protein n=1 Tax=Halobacillus sp. A1 TaxID=2880262 RepID=UPI0020A67007|nr:hypothetical protein [Halobacillus sp. A1]MCP3033025.1 hypothetical protein [Halobacillus sp. A1]
MSKRGAFLMWAWVAFIGYAMFLAPSDDPGYLRQLITMDDPDPLLLSVFSMLGMFPIAFTILLIRNDEHKWPAMIFALASFGLGAFALMPYFAWVTGIPSRPLRFPKKVIAAVQHPVLLGILGLGVIGLVLYGVISGDYGLYSRAFMESSFVHVMTIDFFVLTGLSVYALHWDAEKRNISVTPWLGLLPVIGILLYIGMTRNQRWKNGTETDNPEGS